VNRSEFLRSSASLACASCATLILGTRAEAADPAATVTPVDEALKKSQAENQFTNNWLDDLFAAIDAEVDPATRLRLMQGCGRGCFNRHKFKQDIAEAGKGDVDKLLTAYKRNFNIAREGDLVHIRYGGGKCFCPAARNRPGRPNDLHCECTRFTHEAIFATALGRHVPIELVETVRRGGKNCHLVARLN
jgi:hypothetical protein